MVSKPPAAATLLLLLLATAALAEDVLVLTNGREAHGKIVEETEAGVRLEIAGGKLFYPRATIREIKRGAAENKPAETATDAADGADSRDEHALLYDDGRRVGTRTFRAAKSPEGFRFEEEIVFLDEKGEPEMQVRTIEKCDGNFVPTSFQVREAAGESEHRMTIGEVRGGRLYVTIAKDGERTRRDDPLPEGARFPLAARELFLRESKALGGKLEAKVYDTRDDRWRPTKYEEGGKKPVDENGRALTLRVVLRSRGDVAEREWIDERFIAHMSELNGEALRAIASTTDVVDRVKRGDTEHATGAGSAARTRYVDAEGGWRIGKPDPSWTFESPAVRGAGALLTVKNAALFASVDVFRDVAAAPDATVERAAEALQRLCRSIAEDFSVVKDGYLGEGPARAYWLEATATTKGEKTKTLARVLVRKGKVWRLLAACPEGAFAALRGDLDKILDSFAVD